MNNRYLNLRPVGKQRRAVALMIVLLAVAALVPVAYLFVVGQNTTMRMAQNMENRAKSRGVAEAGLRIAIAYVRRESSWRTEQNHGDWVLNVPYGDGAFTVLGQDGRDSNGDGVLTNVDATDGDLADDPEDPLTLTVTGRVDGATHVVRAVLTPASGNCGPGIVVSDGIDAAGADDSAGSRIVPLGSSASIATNSTTTGKIKIRENAAITTNVFIGPGGNADNEPGGVVTIQEQGQFSGDVQALEASIVIPTLTAPTGTGSHLGNTTLSSGTTTWTGNRHYGDLVIQNSAILAINGQVTVWCEGSAIIRGNAQLNLTEGSTLTLYVGGTCLFQDNAQLNVNTSDPDSFIIRSLATGNGAAILIQDYARVYGTIEAPYCELTVDDYSHLYGTFVGRAVATRTDGQIHVGCREATTQAAAVNLMTLTSLVAFGGWNSVIDAFDRTLGTYGPSNQSNNARVTVNATGSDKIILYSNAAIRGDALIGPGGNVATGIKTWETSVISGQRGTLEQVVAMPTLTAPTGPPFAGPNSGNIELWGNLTSTISTNRHLNSILLWGNSRVTVSGDVTVLLSGNLEVDTDARFELLPGAKLTLYVRGNLALGGKVNANTADPSKLKLYMLGSTKYVDMWGSAELHAQVQNPLGDLRVWSNAQFFGTYMGRALWGGGKIHLDRSGTGGPGGGEGGATVYTYTTRWLESS